MTNEPIDAEVMPAEKMAVATRPQMAVTVAQPMGVKEIIAQVKLIQDVMRSVMTEGEHYGTIPGCGDKKTLLQPGAQKLTMTFRLAPSYEIQETDLAHGHKEFRVICSLKSTSGAFVGQGVGCCSSMESKYRYRGGVRKCPECGKEAIIMGKQFKPSDPPPGWLCWKRKGGCGATWLAGDPRIENQSIEKVENENPADTFNTVLKMAKKRAFVDATITATAASDIFTQDVGDDENPEEGSQPPPGPRRGSQHTTQPPKAQRAPSAAPAPAPKTVPYADENTRGKMLRKFEDHKVLTEFFVKIGWLLPNSETVADLPLRYVPITARQGETLESCFKNFEAGGDAVAPYKPNPSKPPPNVPHGKEQKPIEVPRNPNPDPNSPTAPWRAFPVPYGKHAGTKLADLDKKVLYGFWANMEVETEYQGRPRKPEQIARDQTFRLYLDEAGQHYEFTKREDSNYEPSEPDDDNVPF